MKKLRFIIITFMLVLMIGAPVQAQEPIPPNLSPSSVAAPTAVPIAYNSLYAVAYSDLWLIDPYKTDGFTYIGNIGFSGTDIAFEGTTLYAISFTQLYTLDPTTGNATLIGNVGNGNVNALTVASDGTMYAGATNGNLLKINKTTGASTLIGNYGIGLGSSGDLAVRFDNVMFATVTRSGFPTDWLVRVDTTTGKATPVGDIGYWGVYGLDFKDWELYGVDSSGDLLKIDTTTGKGTLIGSKSATFWGLSTSGPAIIGNITAPSDNYTTGPASVPITATAEYPGGSGVNQVEFYVFNDDLTPQWRSLGNDLTSPYSSLWEAPVDLNSQQVFFRIDVVGTDNQSKLQRASYAGGVRRINFIQSLNNPNVTENWVPNRAYLNQRSLASYTDSRGEVWTGDSQCNVSSIAMILAMDGYIYSDYLTMANKANSLAHFLFPGGSGPGVTGECNALKDAVPSAYCSGAKSQSDGWTILKGLIDGGHPIILDARPAGDGGMVTDGGHYIVAVGYKESGGKHYIIAYDPFGKWKNYLNGYFANAEEPASHVGKWVYYEYEEFTSAGIVYMFSTVTPILPTGGAMLTAPNPSALTPPDAVSDEPRVSVMFDGFTTKFPFYLPNVNH